MAKRLCLALVLIAILFEGLWIWGTWPHYERATLYQSTDTIATFETLDGNLWDVEVNGEVSNNVDYVLMFKGKQVVDFKVRQ